MLVVQRRIDGSVEFNRNWTEYKRGFDKLPVDSTDRTGEFCIGLYSFH